MSEPTGQWRPTAAEVVEAALRTEALAVRGTWAKRSCRRPDGPIVDCGCALVLLARSVGLNPFDLPDNPHAYAEALGMRASYADGLLAGWDGATGPAGRWRGPYADGYAAGEAAWARLVGLGVAHDR